MKYWYCQDISLFTFPVNLIAGAFLILGIWILYRYYSHNSVIHWFTSVAGTLWVCGLIILLLIIEGIWAFQLFKTWFFILLLLLLIVQLGLITLKKVKSLTTRNCLFLLNHGGLWFALFAALLGASDREEYKMIVPLHQPEYNALDHNGILHPLPFTVRLDKFELEYYPQTNNARIPKRFCSRVSLKSRNEEIRLPIEVNQPVHFKGYTLYQDGYDLKQGADSEYTILLVVRDPWLWLVYTGIFMLLAGAIGLIIYGPIHKIRL